MKHITAVLSAVEQGDANAANQLLPLVYDELRQLAASQLAKESSGQTLQATDLVHEAYLRLVDVDKVQDWNSRGHFFAAAAEAMRRILVERARHKASLKAGGKRQHTPLEQIEVASEERPDELLALDEALAELERHDPQIAELVKLRYFAGLPHQQAAEVLGIGRRAADRLWSLARAWLLVQIKKS